MLYGNRSISHYTPSNVTIWMAMAFQAGILNIGGFMACHRFVSHVTGFSTYFGVEASQLQFGHALSMLTVPLFFLFGSMLSGVLVDLRLKLHKDPKYYVAFGIIFLLILSVYIGGETGRLGTFGEEFSRPRDYVLLALLCLICGVQNGTITSVSKSVIRTTHLTGIVTDLGIGTVRVLNRHKLPGDIRDDIRANLMRAGIVFFFGLGSVLGGFVFLKNQYRGFLLPVFTSGVLFGAMFYFQVIRRRQIKYGASAEK